MLKVRVVAHLAVEAEGDDFDTGAFSVSTSLGAVTTADVQRHLDDHGGKHGGTLKSIFVMNGELVTVWEEKD